MKLEDFDYLRLCLNEGTQSNWFHHYNKVYRIIIDTVIITENIDNTEKFWLGKMTNIFLLFLILPNSSLNLKLIYLVKIFCKQSICDDNSS